jgi:hypothetical protein
MSGDGHASATELSFPHLAKHEQDERRVEEILAGGHVDILRGTLLHVVGAEVETRVDLRPQPAG